VGGAYSFDGVAGGVQAASEEELDDIFAQGGAVELWFRSNSTGQGGFGRLVHKGNGPPTIDGTAVYLFATDPPRLRLSRGVGSDPPQRYDTPAGAFAHDVWTHVVISFDDSDLTVPPDVFADGLPVTATLNNSVMGPTVTDAPYPLRVGNAEAGNRTFDGIVDEVRIARGLRGESWARVQHDTALGMLTSVGDEELQP
jgi:hypothetical protein